MRIVNGCFYLAIVLTVAIGLASSASAANADIVGTYSAEGTNPGGKGGYKATVIVSKTEDTYKIVWDVGGTVYIGTGIVMDNILSVVYADENKKWFGVVTYKILDDGERLSGKWCAHGGKLLGKETLKKKWRD